MQFTRVTTAGTRVAQQAVPNAQVARLTWQALRADLYIHQQADQILANKQIRDIWEDWCAAHLCGCPQCRHAYRMTLVSYAMLNARPLAYEGMSARGHTWYTRHSGGSPWESR
jgi:hypothetical protein